MSVVSGIFAADAASDAAEAQANASIAAGQTQSSGIKEAAQISADTQMEMFNKGLDITQDSRDAGDWARKRLMYRMAVGPQGVPDRFDKTMDEYGIPDEFTGELDRGGEFNFEASPGYQFRQDEARRALENNYSKIGYGGNAIKAISDRAGLIASDEFAAAKARYDQDRLTKASEFYTDKGVAVDDRARKLNEYYTEKGSNATDRSNALNEYYASLNPAAALSGTGQIASQQAAQQANQTGANVGNTQMTGGQNAATASANAIMNAGNANAAGGVNVANAYGSITKPATDVASIVATKAAMKYFGLG